MQNLIASEDKKDKILKVLTNISFLSLSLFPLLKESINSISIILCTILVILNFILNPRNVKFTKDFLLLSSMFWFFLFYEIFVGEFEIKILIRYVPFLIFPLIFWIRPLYIGVKLKRLSIGLFQISVVIACCYYLVLFGIYNGFENLFHISRENIPFFRDYIYHHASLDIHPTYFSAFLLISFTISGYQLIIGYFKHIRVWTHIINMGFTTFMIFLFSSRIVLIGLFITIFFLILFLLKKLPKKNVVFFVLIFTFLVGILFLPFRKIVYERFEEAITEYKKPVSGNYHNSTNIRVAILQCSLFLIDKAPFEGYGSTLQNHLDTCYEESFESNFSVNRNYNTHNYFVNMLLYGGWIFLVLFLCYFIFLISKLKNSTLAILFIIQIILINLTENYFSRHYGVITFNYFICLFYFFKETKVIDQKLTNE